MQYKEFMQYTPHIQHMQYIKFMYYMQYMKHMQYVQYIAVHCVIVYTAGRLRPSVPQCPPAGEQLPVVRGVRE